MQVYVVAQRMSKRCSVDEYAIALARHFINQYPLVSVLTTLRQAAHQPAARPWPDRAGHIYDTPGSMPAVSFVLSR
jgi:hypothetical protein